MAQICWFLGLVCLNCWLWFRFCVIWFECVCCCLTCGCLSCWLFACVLVLYVCFVCFFIVGLCIHVNGFVGCFMLVGLIVVGSLCCVLGLLNWLWCSDSLMFVYLINSVVYNVHLLSLCLACYFFGLFGWLSSFWF